MTDDPNNSGGSPRMGGLEWGLLVLLSILWGGSFFFNAVAIAELPVFTVVVSRLVIAALILWLVVIVTKAAVPRDRDIWVAFIVMGVLNNAIPFSLIVWGQSHIASGLASILNATTPLFSVVLAHLYVAGERITLARLAGIGAGLVGVVIMVVPDLTGGLLDDLAAQLACLAAALSYGVAGIYGRRFAKRGIAPLMTATGQVTGSSLVLVPAMLVLNTPWALSMPGMDVLAALIGVGVLSTALAYLLYFRILATAGATNLLLVTFLVPVSAILLGVIVLSETLHANEIAGMVCIALGLAAIDGRPFARLSRFAVGKKAG